MTEEQITNWFTHHPPTGDQVGKYENIRRAGFLFAKIILEDTPPGADQTAAIRHVRDAVMTANAAIACEGK